MLAAFYLDAGLEKTRAWIDKVFSTRIEALNTENEYAADFKTRLQEITQKRFRSVPDYRMLSAEGPEHAKIFVYEVYVNDKRLGQGSGPSRKAAEQEAASNALKENYP